MRGAVLATTLFLAAAVALTAASFAAPASTPGKKTFSIPALSSNWFATGLRLAKGDQGSVRIISSDATCHTPSASDCPVGKSAGYTCMSNPVVGTVPDGPGGDSIPYGDLIGRVGANGKPFAIHGSVTVSGPGELFLVYNDCAPPVGYSDNGGSYRVEVSGYKEKPNLAIDWSMEHRLYPDNSDWGGEYGLPPASYVSPGSWKLDLFLTEHGEKSCPAGATFDWTVARGAKTIKLDSHHCSVLAEVPALGVYSVTAKEIKDGEPTGTVVTNSKVVAKDWLIVGLGDSNGSGQGNPPYLNRRCDRSDISYQYQTAYYIEQHDPRSSVTFVFDACSGARSDQLWKDGYEGQEPTPGPLLPPQLDQVKSVIGDRKPDAVIMSIGINDLFFGSIMAFCSTYNITGTAFTNHTCESAHVTAATDDLGYTTGYSESPDFADPTVAQRTTGRLAVLPARLGLLGTHLEKLGAQHIFATQYPDETTGAGGKLCNGTGPFPRLSSTVWGWLEETGDALNRAVAGTASHGWIPITGVADGFRGHGYCSPDSYFDTALRSKWEQANLFGAFHATAKGAAITFGLTRDKVCEKLYGNAECNGLPPAPR